MKKAKYNKFFGRMMLETLTSSNALPTPRSHLMLGQNIAANIGAPHFLWAQDEII